MNLKIIQSLLCYFVYVIAFEDLIYVYGDGSQEMQEQGRVQYQLLQERGKLPHYGTCWKDAIRHVDDGCRNLSEEKQMEIALHLTDCFLGMSGHDTYDCALNKKSNVRGICITSMSDRAFHVYTEFYTHTQNICWFLRGQIWHETIAENTWKVGQQLEDSAKNQEQILQHQKESLQLQERLIDYGNALEKTMEKFYRSSKDNQETLSMFSSSLQNLQAWLLGEISWFDTIIFYIISSSLIVFFTSVPRTNSARLIALTILTLNTVIERLICYLLSRHFETDIRDIQINYHFYVWCSRYISIFIIFLVLIITVIFHRNIISDNNKLLKIIYDKLNNLSNKIDMIQPKSENELNVSYEMEDSRYSNIRTKYNDLINSELGKQNYCDMNNHNQSYSLISRKHTNGMKKISNTSELKSYSKYNLRSRGATPEIHV